MSKDPAILFYPADFLIGTIEMSHEQVGQYIRLLCYMHQKGRLSWAEICTVLNCPEFAPKLPQSCPQFAPLLKKFKKKNNGQRVVYYNERLEKEMKRRAEFTESRRLNGKKGGRPKGKNYSGVSKNENLFSKNHMDNHMGNVNENIKGGAGGKNTRTQKDDLILKEENQARERMKQIYKNMKADANKERIKEKI